MLRSRLLSGLTGLPNHQNRIFDANRASQTYLFCIFYHFYTFLEHLRTKKKFRKFLQNFHPCTYLWWPMAPVINIMGIGKNLQNRSDQNFFLSNNFFRFFSGGVPGFFWTLNSVSAFILSKYFSNIFLRPPAKAATTQPPNQPTKKHTTRNPMDHPINGFFRKNFFAIKMIFSRYICTQEHFLGPSHSEEQALCWDHKFFFENFSPQPTVYLAAECWGA